MTDVGDMVSDAIDATLEVAEDLGDSESVDPAAAAATEKCMTDMKMLIGRGNVTSAANNFMNCVSIEGGKILETGDDEEEEEEEEDTGSGAVNRVISTAFLVAAGASALV